MSAATVIQTVQTAPVPGDRVLLTTSEGKEDTLIYELDSIKRAIAYIKCEKTGKSMKVHKSRIRKVLEHKEENMTGTVTEEIAETTTSANIVTRALESETEAKPARAKKSQEPPPAVDFTTLINEGFEIWTKEGLKFDVDDIDVRAHCLIAPDKAAYEVFNTYNGSLGKKGTRGQTYHFSEKNTIEKKRKALEKKGYVLFEG